MVEAKIYYNITGLDWLCFVKPVNGGSLEGNFKESYQRGAQVAAEMMSLFPDLQEEEGRQKIRGPNNSGNYDIEKYFSSRSSEITLTQICCGDGGDEAPIVRDIYLTIKNSSVSYSVHLIDKMNHIVIAYRKKDAVSSQHTVNWHLDSNGHTVLRFPDL